MPRHPPIALKTLDRSHCQYPPRNPEGIVAQARSEGSSPIMELAQKDQLLEIGSRARLGRPIICKRLSVPCDKSRSFRIMKFEQIFSLRCQTEQAESQEARRKLFFRMTSSLISTQHQRSNLAIAPRQSCGSRGDATILADRALLRQSCGLRIGGAGRDRTDDILLAKQALSQLSYGP